MLLLVTDKKIYFLLCNSTTFTAKAVPTKYGYDSDYF